ncbi:Argonaute-3 [Ladona fulva]|uniref:Argonaute-3 n=1 Tax=Ladona fulva TaxID=123851 RepID=A0A8K0KL10_LADFU|nr:Argonaute-3 [Ladona fulva]
MSSPNNYQQLVVNAVVGQSVLTRYNNRTYRVDDIYWNMNPSSCFGEKEKEISFLQYYKTQYDITIRDKKQPVLVSRMKRLRGEQETEIEICLIPELCYMTGLTDRMRADYMLMKSVAVYTRITPEKRHQSLLNFIKSVNETPKARELLADWGLSLKNETMELQTRQFPAEEIYTGDGELASKKPDFGMDITRKKAYDPRPLENWFLLCTRKDANIGNTFVETAKRVGPSMGIQVYDPKMDLLPNDRVDTYVNALRSIPRSSQVQLVVIIFPSSRDDRYAAVKRVTCCDFGIPSQVINSRTLGRPDKVRAIVQKIILQITCKLGGSLWSLKIPMTHAMICGIDVYHDPVRKGKSVGAFISSLNSTCTYWYSQSNFMDQGQELVNGVFPNRIFIYRDGIGDGQLKVSKELEVPQFEACFKRVSEDYNPKLTVFIVQKRINTRIFSRQRDGGLANPPPGTVVDSIVTRRNWADFFLVSQSVREGTVTPTHYIVLHDSSQMKVDQLQRLTYKLCFMYYNWPGGVRVPAPCQYAHKLAYLAGQHLHQPHNQYLSDKLFFL